MADVERGLWQTRHGAGIRCEMIHSLLSGESIRCRQPNHATHLVSHSPYVGRGPESVYARTRRLSQSLAT